MSTLTSVVVFEGTSYVPDAKVFRATQLTNPADEIDRIKPSGDYSGRTDEIISSLISDYCTYVTAGMLSNGTAMGTITFSGDKTLRRILHQFAEIDGFTWYLKPQGQLFYDDGTNDTGVDITTDDVGNTRPSDVDAFYQNTGINAVIVRGAYVGSVRVESAEQTDEADILLNGKTRIIVTDSTIDTTALANSKASAILTREGSNPLTARFGWRNTTKGLPQKGQSITLKVDTTDVNITSQQFILDKINYDGKTDQQAIECSTGLVFKIGDDNERLPEENSQQIAQVAGSVVDNQDDAKAWLAIGAANAREKVLPCTGGDLHSEYIVARTIVGVAGTNFTVSFDVDLPHTLGSLSLYIEEVIVDIYNSGAADYLDVLELSVYGDYDSRNPILNLDHDTLSGTAKGRFTYDSNDDGDLPLDMSSYILGRFYLSIVSGTAYNFQLTALSIKYYYA